MYSRTRTETRSRLTFVRQQSRVFPNERKFEDATLNLNINIKTKYNELVLRLEQSKTCARRLGYTCCSSVVLLLKA